MVFNENNPQIQYPHPQNFGNPNLANDSDARNQMFQNLPHQTQISTFNLSAPNRTAWGDFSNIPFKSNQGRIQ